jgi:hypothetical protein
MTPGEYFKTHYTALAIGGQWEKKGEVHLYDGLFAVQARLGPYEAFQFKLYRKKEEFGSSALAINLGERLVDVAAGQMLYLGEIKITILDKERDKKGKLIYHFRIAAGNREPRIALEGDLEEMRALFPAVVAAFPAGPVTVTTSQAPVQTTIDLKE